MYEAMYSDSRRKAYVCMPESLAERQRLWALTKDVLDAPSESTMVHRKTLVIYW